MGLKVVVKSVGAFEDRGEGRIVATGGDGEREWENERG